MKKIKTFPPQILLFSLFLVLIFNLLNPPSSFEKLKIDILKNPQDSLIHLQLAKIFLWNNDYQKAEFELHFAKKYFRGRTSLAKDIFQTESLIQKPKQFKNQIRHWKEIVKSKPNYRDAYLQLAKLYWQIYDEENSQKNLQSALKLDPNFPPALTFQNLFP